ncbi:MAG: hypothetical protein EOO73_26920 [Myxococcales bacterium]|nr:MAG: hypothetical protein EOO73_26920 [Myxococcales bacterium]
MQGLVDRSRAPRSHPHAVSPEVVQLLETARMDRTLKAETARPPAGSMRAQQTCGSSLESAHVGGRRETKRPYLPFDGPVARLEVGGAQLPPYSPAAE